MSEESSAASPDSAVTGKLAKLNANTGREVTESEKVAAEVLLDASPPLSEMRAALVTEMKSLHLSEDPRVKIDFRQLVARKVSLTERVDSEGEKPDYPGDEIE